MHTQTDTRHTDTHAHPFPPQHILAHYSVISALRAEGRLHTQHEGWRMALDNPLSKEEISAIE